MCIAINIIKSIFQICIETRENHNQRITVDVTSNIIEYNVQDNGINVTYVDDYNMVFKIYLSL